MRGIVRAVALIGSVIVAYCALFRRRHLTWGAEPDEVRATLPGDDLVPFPKLEATRAVTIEARPEDVWPWLMQLGADRGGFFSYDTLENLFGLGIHTVDRYVGDWQHVQVGDFIAADARARGGWYVERVEPHHALVLRSGDPNTGERFEPCSAPLGCFVWSFVLEPRDGSTRLLARARYGYPCRWAAPVVEAIELADFLMTERMLRGIKTRAERFAAQHPAVEPTGTA